MGRVPELGGCWWLQQTAADLAVESVALLEALLLLAWLALRRIQARLIRYAPLHTSMWAERGVLAAMGFLVLAALVASRALNPDGRWFCTSRLRRRGGSL